MPTEAEAAADPTEVAQPAVSSAVDRLPTREAAVATPTLGLPPATPIDSASGAPALVSANLPAVSAEPQPSREATVAEPSPAPTRPDPAAQAPQRPADPLPTTPADRAIAPAPTLAQVALTGQLDLARDSAWLDQLARDIARTAAHDGELRFRLNPEHLGSLAVEVRGGADGASIRLHAETEQARAALAEAQPRLLAEARAQGLRVSEAQIFLGQGGGGGQPRHAPAPQPVPLRTAPQPAPAVTVNEPIAARAGRYA